MTRFVPFLIFPLSLIACVPRVVERKVCLNIYSTSTSERQFEVLISYGDIDTVAYHLKGTNAKHDSLALDSGLVNISFESDCATLSQSLWVVSNYAEPTVDIYLTEVDSNENGSVQQHLFVSHYDKSRLLLE